MKLLAIDGNSIINRAFYGIKLLTAKDGTYTNAVYGFINILNRLTELEKPEGVAVAFDLKAPTFRHKKYAEYKAGRKGMPEELAQQMPIMKEWLTLAGYTCVECETYEADDILGTLAALCEKSGNECVIATGDRDSLQLVSDTTRVLLAATKMGKPEIINYDKAALFERYGLTPPEMIELKSLMGDSSDNIPGVAGVGEKTATDLITRFHSIDNIYESLETLDIKESVRKKLEAGRESAYLSRELGTICREAPINTDISHYKIKPRNDAELARLMTRLEFFKLMEKMGLKPDNSGMQLCLDMSDKKSFKFIKNAEIKNKADIYIADEKIAAVSGDTVTVISDGKLEELLKDGGIKKRVHDFKNLSKKYSDIAGVRFDTMLAAYLCNPSASSYATDRIIAEYAPYEPEIEGETDEFIKNACLFSLACDTLENELEKTGQKKLFDEIELPLARVLGEMELCGFSADVNGLKALSSELDTRIKSLESEIYSLVGYEFNLNSPKQLGVALFEKLGLPAKKKTKSGYSTNAETLEKLRGTDPIISLILDYRQLSKLRSTYTEGLLKVADEKGRVHTTFTQTVTATGRLSSVEPNLQNIPVRTELGRELRRFFVAPQGKKLIDADYSQIELRLLACISGDQNMINAFQNGVDIHTVTASQVFGVPPEAVTPEMRKSAKAVNFGIVYGISAFSLSEDLGVTRAEADDYIKSYFRTYPGIERYLSETVERAKREGYVTTLSGRRRSIPELTSGKGMLKKFGERVAMNSPIQGTAADIIKKAMIRVDRALQKAALDARLILQVHDELIVECSKKDVSAAAEILRREMEGVMQLAVPLTVELNIGDSWYECK